MKPELASKPEKVIEILRRNFTVEQLSETIAPMLSSTNRALFPDAQLEIASQKKVTKVEQMVALLKDSYTQSEIDSLIIPKLLAEEGGVSSSAVEINAEPL